MLTSILIYFFSFFRVSKQVVDKLVRLQRNFLWDGAADQKKIDRVRWDKVCLPKEEGGLGVKDITSFNISLLGKWKWDLVQNQGETWTKILESKYGGWRNLDAVPRASLESLWWRELKTINQITHQGQQLGRSTLWKVRRGDKIKFWEDRWLIGETKLSEKYPRLYTISTQQHQLIQQLGVFNEKGWE